MTIDHYLAIQKTGEELYEGYLPAMDKVFYCGDVVEVMLYAKTEIMIGWYGERRIPDYMNKLQSTQLAEKHFKNRTQQLMLLTLTIDVE